jgi:NADPH-dependent 2,4-dienoyl-CoA reductase/sulfur reductase-like enzyme
LQHVRELLGHLHDGDAVVVIGSGFIGCEISSSLRHRGHPVTLVSDEPGPQQTRLGEEVAARLAGWLRADGVELRLGAAVDALCPGPGDGLRVQAGDVDVPATRVVLAGGAVPRLQLARAVGLPIDGGGVVADAAMRTPREDILVAGDIAFARNRAAGRPLRVEHWGEALAQGEVAGRSAAGQTAAWEAVPGFWSTIGTRTLKQAAWGDGHDAVQLTPHPDGAFTARYVSGGRLVGVLTHDRDQDYERGQDEIARAAQAP